MPALCAAFGLPPVAELGDVAADVLAAGVERRALALVQGQFEGLLDTRRPDYARDRGKDAPLAMLARKQCRAAGDVVLVAQHRLHQAHRGVGDRILGAALARIGHVAATAGALLDGRLVKAEGIGVLAR